MAAFLQFSNLCPSLPKGKITCVLDNGEDFRKGDAMAAHELFYGTKEGWNYYFSLVIITIKKTLYCKRKQNQ